MSRGAAGWRGADTALSGAFDGGADASHPASTVAPDTTA